jgi:preprotein translocase subunit SecF
MADEYVSHDEIDTASRRDATGTALVYVTTLLLLAAIFLFQKAAQEKFNTGMFGGGTPAAR